jgi:CMP-2-keto-3-deoxyoctulosonic acid synthetase
VKGEYKTYVLKSSPKLEQMEVLLKRNKIEFAYADESKAKGFNYQTQESQNLQSKPMTLS